METSKKRIPVKEGLWAEPTGTDSRPHLIGHTCSDCGELFFPPKSNGLCTYCHSTNLKEIALSRKGTINTFSVVEMRPPGGDYRGDVPYAIGFVSLPEGVRVQTLITGCDPEDITVGMEVEMIIDVLHEDDEGNEIMAYKFRPAAS